TTAARARTTAASPHRCNSRASMISQKSLWAVAIGALALAGFSLVYKEAPPPVSPPPRSHADIQTQIACATQARNFFNQNEMAWFGYTSGGSTDYQAHYNSVLGKCLIDASVTASEKIGVHNDQQYAEVIYDVLDNKSLGALSFVQQIDDGGYITFYCTIS